MGSNPNQKMDKPFADKQADQQRQQTQGTGSNPSPQGGKPAQRPKQPQGQQGGDTGLGPQPGKPRTA